MSDESKILAGVGLGCARLRGGLELRNSRKMVDRALELGIRHFDVAPSYGDGEAESILGTALTGMRETCSVYTKFGLPASAQSTVGRYFRPLLRSTVKPVARLFGRKPEHAPIMNTSVRRDFGTFSVEAMRRSLATSLTNLKADRLDGLLLHEPSPADPDELLLTALAAEVTSGTIAKWGLGTGYPVDSLPQRGSIAQGALLAIPRQTVTDREIWVHGLMRYSDLYDTPAVESSLRQLLADAQPTSRRPISRQAKTTALAVALLATKRVSGVVYSTTTVRNLESFVAQFKAYSEVVAVRMPTDIDAFLQTVHLALTKAAGHPQSGSRQD